MLLYGEAREYFYRSVLLLLLLHFANDFILLKALNNPLIELHSEKPRIRVKEE